MRTEENIDMRKRRTGHAAARLFAAALAFVVACFGSFGAFRGSASGKAVPALRAEDSDPRLSEENPQSGSDGPLVVVSVGDSYSSGEGLEDYENEHAQRTERAEFERISAHRSGLAWPGLLTFSDDAGGTLTLRDYCSPLYADATEAPAYWYSVTASGATTEHLNIGQPRGLGTKDFYVLPRQLEVFQQLPKPADYVTITLGGNDAHFAEVIGACIASTSLFQRDLVRKVLDQTWKDFFSSDPEVGIRTHLLHAYRDISEAAGPQACLVVVGYPTLLSEGGMFISKDEAALVNHAIREFNREIADIVRYCDTVLGMNICFVSVEKEFAGHEANSADPYIFPIIIAEGFREGDEFRPVKTMSMHPNEAGTAAYARAVQKRIDRLIAERSSGKSDK